MTKRRALWILCAVVAGLSMVVGGIIVGTAAFLVNNPPALLLAVGDYIYVETLTDEEREEIILERIESLEGVRAAKVLKHDPDWSMEIDVLMENPDPKLDQYWAVQNVCNKVDRTVLPLEK